MFGTGLVMTKKRRLERFSVVYYHYPRRGKLFAFFIGKALKGAASFPSLDHFEQERRVFFLLLAFRRQDVGFLRRHAFSLISLPLFVHVSPNTRSKQFDKYPQLKRMWRKVETKRQACQQEGRGIVGAFFWAK